MMKNEKRRAVSVRIVARWYWLLWLLLSLLLLVQCRPASEVQAPIEETEPPPTLHPLFKQTVQPTSQQTSGEITSTPVPDPSPAPARALEMSYVDVYDDDLNAAWTLENSTGVNFELENEIHTYQGDLAIQVQPQKDFGQLYFTVQDDLAEAYPRDQVLGVRFWLYSADDYIGTSDLGVAVVGSNQYSYWVADDQSVPAPIPGEATFSETRLYYLDINRDIPPDTWVEVVLWLDEQPYDPLYRYVTGFYVKHDEGFQHTYFVDKVQLILIDEAA